MTISMTPPNFGGTIPHWLLLVGAASIAGAQDGYPSGGRPGGYRPGIDVQHYDLSIDLPDSGAAFEGRAVLTIKRTTRVTHWCSTCSHFASIACW